jgi:5-methylcytosine-specific restriction endonuclease McrA
MNRAKEQNYSRFPSKKNEDGKPLCRMCGAVLTGRRTSFCGRRCLRDFFMLTDWKRVRMVVFYRDGGACMKCGKPVPKDGFHIDHIVPISKGGDEWDLKNLELSCPDCNLRKGARDEFIPESEIQESMW